MHGPGPSSAWASGAAAVSWVGARRGAGPAEGAQGQRWKDGGGASGGGAGPSTFSQNLWNTGNIYLINHLII